MLVLTRKKNESIIIDEEIKIKILDITNNKVQLGIEAPQSIPVHREEVYQEIQIENKLAAQKKVKLPAGLSKKMIKKEKEGLKEE